MKVMFVVGSMLLAICQAAHAEPTGSRTTIASLRPYVGGSTAFVYVSNTSPCGVEIYSIDLSTPSGKAAYAQALASVLSGKQVQLEVTACTGIYSAIQSIYIFP